ncbi:uncharacterized protein DUF2789 [Paraperlucidibaca baekdonensis]|uniref:Uncharacterized protein DUF2789 n=1 Tax=Paraperlucidibaca baekdonensis TaxID=748120 RepID=A0A3E0H6J8_9GAMM|nr:DUF2789 family protein [Paraperlucidibaca baekdonensis]REH39130.1 uncharacterized protein DUF2789 [Paraperlucidibaca baekdonensis]
MQSVHHSMSELFKQLGLPDSDAQIQQFIATHRPIADTCPLPEAVCWSDSQASFLREAVALDSDWAVVVDQLSQALRSAD